MSVRPKTPNKIVFSALEPIDPDYQPTEPRPAQSDHPVVRQICRHKQPYSCDDCHAETWNLANSVGKEDGLGAAIAIIHPIIAAAFLAHKEERALDLREIYDRLMDKLATQKLESYKHRVAQGIIKK